jgi:hypothetical protein
MYSGWLDFAPKMKVNPKNPDTFFFLYHPSHLKIETKKTSLKTSLLTRATPNTHTKKMNTLQSIAANS